MDRALIRRLLGYMRPYVWPYFAGAMACMILFGATNGVMPFLVRFIFDDIFTAKNAAVLQVLPIAIILVFVFRGLCGFGSAYLSEYVSNEVINDLRKDLNAHIQDLSLGFFTQHPTGALLSRVTSDVYVIGTALTGTVASILKDGVSLIALLVVAFYQDWVLALIAIVVFPASVLPMVRLSKKMRAHARKLQGTLGVLTALLQETVQGNRVVKAFNMQAYEKSRFAAESRGLQRTAMRVARIRAFTTPMMEILAAFGIAGVVWYGGYSVIAGGRTQGSFLAFLTALFLLYDPFKGLGRANGTLQQGLAAADRVFELLDTAPQVADRADARALPPIERSIEFEAVTFAYQDEPVLRDVSLTIRRGEVLALVGPSGGGKSTLADLLLRFYDVTRGAIRIDGIDIRDVTQQSLREQMALVTQHTFLFNDTVRNNIAYGSIEQPMEAIIAAARAANAHQFISELPQGYDTMIGELGLRLSGGQRQRIAIARALLKNAPILVLDEATSALDNESERLVQQALDTLMHGRTTLVIAHRLSTVRNADRIVVLVRGAIAEQGTHDELLARNGDYRRLHDLQFSDTTLDLLQ
ncbi:MAG: lipid A export permease/ATP-binding protein MsbA [Deltaproteobacteria bacterium]|nr:lipid A export permease/ATP-binding protein MsbA [Deltaproteobacteria bacterium]